MASTRPSRPETHRHNWRTHGRKRGGTADKGERPRKPEESAATELRVGNSMIIHREIKSKTNNFGRTLGKKIQIE